MGHTNRRKAETSVRFEDTAALRQSEVERNAELGHTLRCGKFELPLGHVLLSGPTTALQNRLQPIMSLSNFRGVIQTYCTPVSTEDQQKPVA